MVDTEKKITFVDDNGKESSVNIYFTYKDEKTSRDYVFFYKDDNNDEIMVARYLVDERRFIDIESKEEYDMLEEILDEYQNQEQI